MLLSMLVNKYLKVSHFHILELLKKKDANIPLIIFFILVDILYLLPLIVGLPVLLLSILLLFLWKRYKRYTYLWYSLTYTPVYLYFNFMQYLHNYNMYLI